MDFLHAESAANVQFDWRAPSCDVALRRVRECSMLLDTTVDEGGEQNSDTMDFFGGGTFEKHSQERRNAVELRTCEDNLKMTGVTRHGF